jgi:hypothetical protein
LVERPVTNFANWWLIGRCPPPNEDVFGLTIWA